MIKTNHKNVNNKRVVKMIDAFVIDIIEDSKYRWGSGKAAQEDVLDMFREFIEEGVQQGKILNYKVSSDTIVVPQNYHDKGVYSVTINFQQTHCLNRTILTYTFGPGV